MNQNFFIKTILLLASILIPATASQAQTFTWTGLGGDNNWSTGLNWMGGIPTSGPTTEILFSDPTVQSTAFQNLATPFQLNQLEFDVTNASFTSAGESLEFLGSNPIVRIQRQLNNGNQINVNQDWILSSNLNVSQLGFPTDLIHSGTISGTGSMTNNAFVTINGAYNSSGAIVVNSRTTSVNGTISAGTAADVFGTLTGTGTINRNVRLLSPGGIHTTFLESSNALTINGDLLCVASNSRINSGTINVNGRTRFQNAALTIASAATLGGTGSIELSLIPGNKTLTVQGTTGTGQTVFLDGDITNDGFTGTILRGTTGTAAPGVVQGSVNLFNGTVTDRLRFSGPVAILPGTDLRFGTNSNGGNGVETSTITIDQTATVLNGSNARFAGNFNGDGQILINDSAITTFDSAIIGPNLITDVNVDSTINASGGRIDGVLNLRGGSFLTTGISPLITATATINALPDSSFSSTASRTFQMTSSPLDTMAFNGQLVVHENVQLTVIGRATGAGQVIIEEGAFLDSMSAELNLNTIVRGTINNFTNQIPSRTLTLEGGNVQGNTILAGALIVQTAQQSVIESGADVFVNGGFTNISSGGLLIAGAALMHGAGGVFVADGANLTVDGELRKNTTIAGGALLEGNGQLEGNLDVAGMLSPGNSAGTIKVKGQINLTNTATVCIEIGGTTPGTGFDVLDGRITSNLDLGNSRLELMLINGFVPDPSHQFVFLQNFNSITGVFGNGEDGFQDGQRISFADGSFGITYSSDSILLNDYQAIPEPSSICLVLMSGLLVSGLRRSKKIS